jgi:hypothetical protein
MRSIGTWLSDQAAGAVQFDSAQCQICEGEVEALGTATPEDIATLVEAGRLQERIETEARCQAELQLALESERAVHQEREREIVERWSHRCSDDFTSAIRSEIEAMRRSLERSLVDVLTPFLDEVIVRRSADSLHDLVKAELGNGEHRVLEIGAPIEMHELLRTALQDAGLSARLVEKARCEVILSDRTLHFESLADTWLCQVRGMIIE